MGAGQPSRSRPRPAYFLTRPKPDLRATPTDPGTDYTTCWARLARQWQLPDDSAARVELSVADLRQVSLELFSAGVVNHEAVIRRLVEKLGAAPNSTLTRLEQMGA